MNDQPSLRFWRLSTTIIDGLNVGDYKLKETKAPDNFNLMQGEKDVTITQNGEALEKHLLANTNNKEISKSAYWYQTVVDKRISVLPVALMPYAFRSQLKVRPSAMISSSS